ncbi:MAG: acyl-CoA dehydrogenase [Phycisphaerae bacterium]|nr:acyl-CoA dehydrogenase [Phycisphaerae bacterium]
MSANPAAAPSNLDRELQKLSEKDRKQIQQAQEMLGPDPASMGLVKNYFWGRFRGELLLPHPEPSAEETARCDQLLAGLDAYLREEHPAIEIDQKQEIPPWVIQKLFDLGVLGMTIPREFGGGGFGITSYNRALERIGRTCGSTAVIVSAHQSIGCKAAMLFGTEEQKKRYLPRMAKDTLSAFCLSEPNVGCDAGGQETRCELSADGTHYVLNGEKKWATSGALSGLFTVMAKQRIKDPKTGKEKDAVTALICTPDMPGIEIFSRNRSKCGIRGTWQARIRLTNVKVPRANLLHKEGKGLNVALTCLNYGRCTLSAGMLGGATYALEQAAKWAQYRHQFDRPLAEFGQVQEKLARMDAYVYAMDAMLYLTTAFLDRHDEDIMLETAMCKVFCSEMGYRTVNDCLQIMGGESYMTENHVERIWRDSRINTIVEGANEVMLQFLFGKGSERLGDWMLGVRANPFKNLSAAISIASQIFLGIRPAAPEVRPLDPRLAAHGRTLGNLIREFAHQVKLMFKEHEEKLVTNQLIQSRLAMSALWIHGIACSLSKCDRHLRQGLDGESLTQELTLMDHLVALFANEVRIELDGLRQHANRTVEASAKGLLKRVEAMPNARYSIPEKTPDPSGRGKGRPVDAKSVPQFGAGSVFSGRPVAEG